MPIYIVASNPNKISIVLSNLYIVHLLFSPKKSTVYYVNIKLQGVSKISGFY